MNREEAAAVLHSALSVGEQMLISGAEVCRVEDSIRRICLAYGAVRVDVFSITSFIAATVFPEGGESFTESRRISGMQNDLHRLDALNRLSRRVCAELPPPETILTELEAILAGPRYSFGVQLAVYALISGSFSVFFGGNLKDMLSSAFIGMLLKVFEAAVRRSSVNGLFTSLLVSTAGGFLARLAVLTGLGAHADLISIGNIMLFIPGIAFTNSLRDMLSGDTITGLIRFSESVLVAIVVALGFTLAHFLF